jgi:hypothetical protein
MNGQCEFWCMELDLLWSNGWRCMNRGGRLPSGYTMSVPMYSALLAQLGELRLPVKPLLSMEIVPLGSPAAYNHNNNIGKVPLCSMLKDCLTPIPPSHDPSPSCNVHPVPQLYMFGTPIDCTTHGKSRMTDCGRQWKVGIDGCQ